MTSYYLRKLEPDCTPTYPGKQIRGSIAMFAAIRRAAPAYAEEWDCSVMEAKVQQARKMRLKQMLWRVKRYPRESKANYIDLAVTNDQRQACQLWQKCFDMVVTTTCNDAARSRLNRLAVPAAEYIEKALIEWETEAKRRASDTRKTARRERARLLDESWLHDHCRRQ